RWGAVRRGGRAPRGALDGSDFQGPGAIRWNRGDRSRADTRGRSRGALSTGAVAPDGFSESARPLFGGGRSPNPRDDRDLDACSRRSFGAYATRVDRLQGVHQRLARVSEYRCRRLLALEPRARGALRRRAAASLGRRSGDASSELGGGLALRRSRGSG